MPEGSKPNESPQALLNRFKEQRSFDAYVLLRRLYPSQVVDIETTNGFEWIASNLQLLKSLQIDADQLASALEGNVCDLSEISLIIMERLIERRKLEKLNRTHLASRGEAISDSMIFYIINMVIESSTAWDQVNFPSDFMFLVQRMHGGATTETDNNKRLFDKQTAALEIAAELGSMGVYPSFRKIGEAMSVNASTVQRWFSDHSNIAGLFEVLSRVKSTSTNHLRK